MGDFVRTLFGGSKQESTQETTSKPVDLTPDAFKNAQQPLADRLLQLISSEGPSYDGPMSAPITANEQTLLAQLMGQTGPGTSRNVLLENTLAGKFLPGQDGSNPFLDAAIKSAQRPTLQGLEETLSRTLPGRFTQAGQFIQPEGSSAFDRAAAIASRGAADALADIATKISFAGYESERGRQQEAIPLSRAEVDSSIKNLQAQALPRLIQELGIERGLQEFQTRTQALLQALQVLGGATRPVIGQESKGTSTSKGESQKGIIPALFPFGL